MSGSTQLSAPGAILLGAPQHQLQGTGFPGSQRRLRDVRGRHDVGARGSFGRTGATPRLHVLDLARGVCQQLFALTLFDEPDHLRALYAWPSWECFHLQIVSE